MTLDRGSDASHLAQGDPLYHASLSPAEYQALAAQFDFRVLQHAINDAHAGRTVWLCQRDAISGNRVR